MNVADMLLGLSTLEPGKSERAKDAVRLLSTITLTSVVGILAIGLVSIMLIRRHRRRLAGAGGGGGGRKKRRPPPDPWFESGRRVPDPGGPGPKSRIIRLPGSDDDTVDIDPEDLDADDVEGEDPDGHPPGSRGG